MLIGLIMVWMVLPSVAYSQTMVKIGNYTGCSNTEVLVPVEVEHFEDISAITIYIQCDTANFDYIDIVNVNDAFSSGDFMAGVNNKSQIVLLWNTLPPAANLDNGVLCNIHLLLKKETVNFNFQQNSEIVQSDFTIIENVEYVDGLLVSLNSYNIDPVSQTVVEESSASIKMQELPDSINCQWQIQNDDIWTDLEDLPPYTGVKTSQLSIESVSLQMNEKFFRCLLSNDFCVDGSSESQLLVTPNGVIEVNGQLNTVSVYPNPVNTLLNCHFNESVLNTELKMVNSKGVIIMSKQLGDMFSGDKLSLNISDFNAGQYILQLFSKGKRISDLKIIKT